MPIAYIQVPAGDYTVTIDGVDSTVSVTAQSTISVPSISFSPTSATVEEGTTGTLAAVTIDNGGDAGATVTLSNDVAQISGASLVLTDAAVTGDTGQITATITNSAGSDTATFDLTVDEAVAPAGVRNLVFLGQSEPHRLFLSNHSDNLNTGTVDDESALEIWWYDLEGITPNNATGVQRDAITNDNKVSRWAVEMSNALAAIAPGVQFKMACLLFAGTGLDDLLDDAQTAGGRYWTRAAPYNGDKDAYDQFITDTGITQPDAAFMSWQNTDSTQMQFQIGDGWWTALTGTGLDDGAAVALGTKRHNVDYDHFLSELWDTDTVPFTFLMHRYDVFTGTGIDWDRFRDVRVSMDRVVSSARNQARQVPFLRGVDPVAYENGYDVGDQSHPRKSDDGAVKYAQQLAYNMARMTGTPLPAPQIDAVTWAAGSVTLASAAGDLTTTRLIRGGTLPAGQPKVAQLYFRAAETPGVIEEVPDAAISIVSGDIVIDAAATAGRNFVRGDRIEFASGPAGANDDQDKTDDTWLDYPGITNATLELVPLQPVCGVMVCDLGSAPAVTNLLQDFATWATGKGLPDQGEGWYLPSVNTSFDSNTSGVVDITGLTGGVDSATLVVDVDRAIGRNGQSSTQISLRDIGGYGHQRLGVGGLWGEAAAALTASDTQPTAYGQIPLPDGRVRMWMHTSITAGGRLIIYMNNANTGGAYGFAGLYDGALPVETIAGL